MSAARLVVVALVAVVSLGASACNRGDTPEPPPATTASPDTADSTERVVGPLSAADAAALATMNDRLKQYLEIHRRVEATLPRRSDNATPEEIDKNQRLFEQRIREARSGARQGDIFTAEAQPVIRRLLASVFAGAEGRELKSSIMDENPVGVKVTVNGRYPDEVPISTVPPQVLQTLPELTEDMEYRFVGEHLIILDAHAHVIADFLENVFPTSRTP